MKNFRLVAIISLTLSSFVFSASGQNAGTQELYTGFFDGHPVTYCVIDGLAIYEGVMILGIPA